MNDSLSAHILLFSFLPWVLVLFVECNSSFIALVSFKCLVFPDLGLILRFETCCLSLLIAGPHDRSQPQGDGRGTTGLMPRGCPVSCLLRLGFPVSSCSHQLPWVLVCYPAISIYTCCLREGSAGLIPIMLAQGLSFSISAWSKPHSSSELCCNGSVVSGLWSSVLFLSQSKPICLLSVKSYLIS